MWEGQSWDPAAARGQWGQGVPVELDPAPWAVWRGAGQPLACQEPGATRSQEALGLFLWWIIKPEPHPSVRDGSALQLPLSAVTSLLPCPCFTLSCPQQVAEQSHQPLAEPQMLCAASAVPRLQREKGPLCTTPLRLGKGSLGGGTGLGLFPEPKTAQVGEGQTNSSWCLRVSQGLGCHQAAAVCGAGA